LEPALTAGCGLLQFNVAWPAYRRHQRRSPLGSGHPLGTPIGAAAFGGFCDSWRTRLFSAGTVCCNSTLRVPPLRARSAGVSFKHPGLRVVLRCPGVARVRVLPQAPARHARSPSPVVNGLVEPFPTKAALSSVTVAGTFLIEKRCPRQGTG
jgi:hypothetical protein